MTSGKAKGTHILNCRKECIHVGTWNVQTLYQTEKTELLKPEMTKYRYDIIGLSEVRWTGNGMTSDGSIIFSGHEIKHEAGVGMILSNRAQQAMIGFKPVSDRIIMARFRAQPMDLTVIQIYAPTAASSDEEIETFYAQLQECLDGGSRKDCRFVVGDWNAKVGKDRDLWEQQMGKFGYA